MVEPPDPTVGWADFYGDIIFLVTMGIVGVLALYGTAYCCFYFMRWLYRSVSMRVEDWRYERHRRRMFGR